MAPEDHADELFCMAYISRIKATFSLQISFCILILPKGPELGIGMGPSTFQADSSLDVLENIVLGLKTDIPPHLQGADLLTTLRRKYTEIFGLNMRAAEAKVTELSEKFGFKNTSAR
jgi:hypothetical protein